MKHLLLLFFLFAIITKGMAINYTAKASGNWNSTATWNPVGIPNAADQVTIDGLYTVTVTTAQECASITVTGALGALTINAGASLNVISNFTQLADDGTDISTVNLNGTMTVGGNLIMSYTYLLAVTSSNTFNIGNAASAGTLNVTGKILFTSNTNASLSQRNLIRHNHGTVNLTGNLEFTSIGQGAAVQAYIMDDNTTFDTKPKRLNIKGTFVNPISTSFTLLDANLNSSAVVNYNGT